MKQLKQLSIDYSIDIVFGYIEREEDTLYSSCVFLSKGCIIKNYRRISKGWKEYAITDHHYKEGEDTSSFFYNNRQIKIALCGDLWDYTDKFMDCDLLLWPIYVNFTLDDWQTLKYEYATRAGLACSQVLMINSLSEEPKSYGGSFHFSNGKIHDSIPFGKEGLLVVEI